MNSFLKSVQSLSNKKSILVKESLRKQLNTTIMELENNESIMISKKIGDCEETMGLCSVLEAIFLHGLKDSLLNRVTEVLSGPDIDAMPQPSFWGPLLVISHREIIDEILNYKQITTEIGRCRTWIRVALRDCLLSSYLSSIQRDNSALKPYYERSAFLRDSENIEIARRLIETLDGIIFNLACNTSLLNFWSSTPLLMAAIWSPPMKSCPVFSAVDIAKTINSDSIDNNNYSNNFDEVETASSIGSIASSSTSQSIFGNYGALSEDDALKIILGNNSGIYSDNSQGRLSPNLPRESAKKSSGDLRKLDGQKKIEMQNNRIKKIDCHEIESKIKENEIKIDDIESKIEENKCKYQEIDDKIEEIEKKIEDKLELDNDIEVIGGNSLIGKLGWSSSLDDGELSLTSSVISHDSTVESPRTPGEGATYDALIKSYHTAGYSESPDLRDFYDKFTPEKSTNDSKIKTLDIEVKIEKPVDLMTEQIGKIPREKGLDIQNYGCFDCGHAIGLTFSKAHVCSFSGNYYCKNCMASEEFSIPSRIIHNWDLKHYPVSQRAAIYLTDCTTIIDLKVLNPKIYSAVESMAQLQILRIQLNLLRAYLSTCREPIIELLEKEVKPREYLYEHVHQYSVGDLLDVPSGALAQQLLKIIEFSKNHVLNCWLCSQKGFICEICNNPKVIYPFDVASTFRCGGCSAVFHSNCLNSKKPCPKCERRKKRLDNQLESDVQQIGQETSPAIQITQ